MDEVFGHRTSLPVVDLKETQELLIPIGRVRLGGHVTPCRRERLGIKQARGRREQHAHQDGELEIKVT